MTISKAGLAALLERMECETLDFKEQSYDLSSSDSKTSLVKDVICMANTPRDVSAYIIMGVRKHLDGSFDLVGIEPTLDDADLQAQFDGRVEPMPLFSYEVVEYEGK